MQLDFDGDSSSPLIARVVFLGTDIERRITRGMNAGKTINEDFVVLKQVEKKGKGSWHFNKLKPPRYASAIAAWIEHPGNPTPIQAVGGPL